MLQHGLVKFVTKVAAEKQTHTSETSSEDDQLRERRKLRYLNGDMCAGKESILL